MEAGRSDDDGVRCGDAPIGGRAVRLTVAVLGWVLLDVHAGRDPVEEHVPDLGVDRTVAVPDDLLGVDGFGFYNQAGR